MQTWNKEVVNTKADGRIAVLVFINKLRSSRVAYGLNELDFSSVESLLKEVSKNIKAESVVSKEISDGSPKKKQGATRKKSEVSPEKDSAETARIKRGWWS